jgi:anti-sigma regulatory factor (Ser/Thr protein kinase)
MATRAWFRPPGQPLATFVAVAAVSLITLAGLSWYVLAQDREQYERARLERVADRAAADMVRALSELQLQSDTADATSLRDGVAVVSILGGAVAVRSAGPVPYLPGPPPSPDGPDDAAFADAEVLEFIMGDLAGAAARYARFAGADDSVLRAGALMRAARVARKRAAPDAALTAYAELEALDRVLVDGLPAGLVARAGRMTVFDDEGRTAELEAEASALLADLQHGRWPISRAVYDAYAADARALLASAPVEDAEALATSEAIAWLWTNAATAKTSGRQVLRLAAEAVLVSWATRPSGVTAVVATSGFLNELASEVFPADVAWNLRDTEGALVVGAPLEGVSGAVRPPGVSGLPWTLQVATPAGVSPPASPQQPWLLTVLSLVTLVITTGWYFVFRSLRRERQVAQLQTDFVAAVSHEFRSPLTSLSHIAELLSQGRLDAADAIRRDSYGVLVRETTRLRDLVEGLLDFGRFDADTSGYRFDVTDVASVVIATASDVQEHVAPAGVRVDVKAPSEPIVARADTEALGRAVRNLLDNAVKYSAGQHTIEVEVTAADRQVSIAVRDHGIGIPVDEQARIFDRFVRGAAASSRRIRGTGIGLAMVRQIARAHGGDVRVVSEPGVGSCFTLELPLVSREDETCPEYSSSKTNPALPSA